MKRTFSYAVFTVGIFFALLEVVLRLTLAPPPSRPFEWPPPDMTKHGLMPDDTRFWKLVPAYDKPWRLYKLAYTWELAAKRPIDWESRNKVVGPVYRNVTWEVNGKGFRGTEIPNKKPPGTVRLLFLGSSITFGWGVSAGDAFPEQIRKKLSEAFPNTVFQALNAGVPGYSSYQGLRYLEEILPQYRPDIVLAEFGINDGTMAVGKSDKDWQPRMYDTILPAVRNSGWGRLVLRLSGSFMEHKTVTHKNQTWQQAQNKFYRVSMTGTSTRVTADDFMANLTRMDTLCRQEGARFVTLIPALYNEYGKGAVLSAVNISTPNALLFHKILAKSPRKVVELSFLPFDEGHLSRTGHQLVADRIVSFIRPNLLNFLEAHTE